MSFQEILREIGYWLDITKRNLFCFLALCLSIISFGYLDPFAFIIIPTFISFLITICSLQVSSKYITTLNELYVVDGEGYDENIVDEDIYIYLRREHTLQLLLSIFYIAIGILFGLLTSMPALFYSIRANATYFAILIIVCFLCYITYNNIKATSFLIAIPDALKIAIIKKRERLKNQI